MFTVQYILHIVLNVSHLLPVWLKFCSVSQLKYSCRSQINPVRCVGSWSWSQVSWCFTAGVHTGEQDSDPDPLYRLLPVPRAIRGPAHRPGHAPPPLPRTHRYPHQPSIQRGGGRGMSAAANDLNTKLPLKSRQLLFILLSVVVVLEWPCSGCSGSVQTGTHVWNTLGKHKHLAGYSKHFSEHLEGTWGLRAEILLFSMEFCM